MKCLRKRIMVLGLTIIQLFRNPFFCFESHVEAAKVFGLRNIGNSCYYNATIQQLYSVDSFRSCLIDLYNSEFKDKDANSIPQEKIFIYNFSKLFYEIYNLKDGDIVNADLLKKSIGFLVDRRGDSIDCAFSAIFSNLDKSGFCFSKDFKNLSIFNIHSVLSPDLEGLSSDEVNVINERVKKIRPNENAIDVIELLNYMSTDDFNIQNNIDESAKNILICLDFFKKKISLNLPEKYVTEDKTFLLKSLSVNTGGHFVVWVRLDNDNWQLISDGDIRMNVCDFQSMFERARSMGNISSLIYSKI